MRACGCVCVHVCVSARVNKEKSTMSRIFANLLFPYFLYTGTFGLIFVRWDYLNVFMCAVDVPAHGAFDRGIKSQSLIVT